VTEIKGFPPFRLVLAAKQTSKQAENPVLTKYKIPGILSPLLFDIKSKRKLLAEHKSVAVTVARVNYNDVYLKFLRKYLIFLLACYGNSWRRKCKIAKSEKNTRFMKISSIEFIQLTS